MPLLASAPIRSCFIALLIATAGCEFHRPPPGETNGTDHLPAQVAREIREMLAASAGSWNSGDLDGYLDDYWHSEELTFSGPEGVIRGWDGLRERYLTNYWAPGMERDSLRFEEIEVVSLGNESALALGKYVLMQPGGDPTAAATGYFSLVLRSMDGEWKIIHDHTSATPEEVTPGEENPS